MAVLDFEGLRVKESSKGEIFDGKKSMKEWILLANSSKQFEFMEFNWIPIMVFDEVGRFFQCW